MDVTATGAETLLRAASGSTACGRVWATHCPGATARTAQVDEPA